MKTRKYEIPEILPTEHTKVVDELLDIINGLLEDNKSLAEEIKRLKGLKGQPKIRPSTLEQSKTNSKDKKRNKDGKTDNKQETISNRNIVVKANNVATGAEFKGYRNYSVQELVIYAENIKYKLERWLLPNGQYLEAELPTEQQGSHYGVVLRTFIKYQYYHARMTEPLLLEQLHEYGIKISKGALDALLKDHSGEFKAEKDEILTTGLSVSKYVNVDDTGARHKGKNGYCTHIGNELFTWFESTESKSRVNFLTLLSQGFAEYIYTAESFDYMKKYRVAPYICRIIRLSECAFKIPEELETFLTKNKVTNERYIQIITEAGLIGNILTKGLFKDSVIVSDDAGQFNVFKHALCWIHAERNIKRIIAYNDKQAVAIQEILDLIWELYNELKSYKKNPTRSKKIELDSQFDIICSKKTCCYALNQQLKKLKANKPELLLVLERPEIPLHNNLSENDIREYVTRRKISAGTKSDEGRESRDTFLSLKKTTRKLGVTFWRYLLDRAAKHGCVPRLSDLIAQAAIAT